MLRCCSPPLSPTSLSSGWDQAVAELAAFALLYELDDEEEEEEDDAEDGGELGAEDAAQESLS